MSTARSRAEALHERARAAVDLLHRTRRDLCVLLAELDADRLYRALGYGTLQDYAQASLDLAPRTARAMAAVGRRLPELPAVDAAMASGELPWTKARTLLPVVAPDTEAAWVERAEEVSCRELETQVTDAAPGELPPGPDRARELAELPGRHRVTFLLDDPDHRVVADGIATLRARTGLSDQELCDGSLLAELVRRALAAESTEEAPTGQRAIVALQQCVDCGTTAGLETPAGDTWAALGTCDPILVEMRPGPDRGKRSSAIPPRVRRAVLLRDARRCQSPRCTNRLWLDLHHVVPRSRGGPHSEENLVTLCGCCHKALHDGMLGVERTRRTGVVAFRYLDGEVVAVALGHGPIAAGGPHGPRGRPGPVTPTPQGLLALGTRGCGRLAAPGSGSESFTTRAGLPAGVGV